MENRTINGWGFKYDEENKMYECRGSVMYDDDHDETPEPSLWRAAEKLGTILTKDGLNVDVNHSEKGWVEVTINNYKIFR